MAEDLTSEALQLYQQVALFADASGAAQELPGTLKDRFFAVVDKVNLHMMDDKDNFYGYFLFQMKKAIRFDIASSTAVNFKQARYVLYFNPLLFLELTPRQMESSIKHEILHVVSLHLLRARDVRTSYSKLAINLAMDIVVNNYLQPLPPDAATRELVNMEYSLCLAPLESFEYYAEEIQKVLDSRAARDEVDMGSRAADELATAFNPLTTHDVWSESDTVDEQLITKFTDKYVEAANRGELSNYLASMIDALKNIEHELPWNWYLRKLLGSIACEHKKTRTRRNRRQPERLELSGCLRDHQVKIAVALDTSGSISDSEFRQAMQEVFQLVKTCRHELTIIECDDNIRRTYNAKTLKDIKERSVHRGGTEFAPVIKYANSQNIDLLVYFTDGKGEEQLRIDPHGYRILWVISGKGEELSLKNPPGTVKKLHPLKLIDTTLDAYDVEQGGFSMNNQEAITLKID